jgi:hypothetical protein
MSGILDAVSFRGFWTEDQIKHLVARESEKLTQAPCPHSDHQLDESTLRTLLVFSTSKQQTWLVADRWMLRCVLDDRRKEELRVALFIKRDQVEPTRANYDYSPSSGVLYFGSRTKGWLFSKSLFHGSDIVEAVRQLLVNGDH